MKRTIARHILIAKLTLALFTFCSLQAQIHAQGMTGYIVIFPSVGLAQGQRFCVSLFNPGDSLVRAEVRIYHPGGAQVALGDGSVRFLTYGVSHTFQFNYRDLLLADAENTNRLQLRVTLSISGVTPGTRIDEFAPTLEVIEESSGSTVLACKDVLLGGSAPDVSSGFANDIIMGIIPGQKLRVTLCNTRSSGAAYVPSRVLLYEAKGSLIAQSSELVIPQGECRTFEVDRNDLLLPGERRTGRQQVPAHLEVSTSDPSSFTTDPTASGLLLASFELIDNSTGRTTAQQNNLKQIGLAFHSFNDSGY
jgi:prepilin-type processing-associated H-X9-DG protein